MLGAGHIILSQLCGYTFGRIEGESTLILIVLSIDVGVGGADEVPAQLLLRIFTIVLVIHV